MWEEATKNWQEKEPERWFIIDAGKTKEEIAREIWQRVRLLIQEKAPDLLVKDKTINENACEGAEANNNENSCDNIGEKGNENPYNGTDEITSESSGKRDEEWPQNG